MKTKTKGGLLVGAGFLLGTVGVKALTSSTAKKAYVQGVAKGIQAKNCYENSVEQAKAQVDDIVAEAQYISVASGDDAAETQVAAEDGKAKAQAKSSAKK